jgi:hypothetical protein
MTHLLLLTLAVLLTWETLRSALPFRLPSLVHSGLVLAMAYGWSFVPVEWLTLAAVASAVGILHTLVGSSDEAKPGLSLPRRNFRPRRGKVPNLPHGRGGG